MPHERQPATIVLGRVLLFPAGMLLLVLSKWATSFLLVDSGFAGLSREDWWTWVSLDLLVASSIFWSAGLYRRDWRLAGVRDLLALGACHSARTLLVGGGLALLAVPPDILSFTMEALVSGTTLTALHLAPRLVRELWSEVLSRRSVPVLIVGAGEAGLRLLRELRDAPELGRRPVGLIDDDPGKQGSAVMGLRVLGGRESIPFLVRARSIEEVIIAIPSAASSEIAGIVRMCSGLRIRCRIATPRASLLEGVRFVNLQEVDPERFLERASILAPIHECEPAFAGETALVTGAAGSIGSELSDQLLGCGVGRLLLLDRCENGLFYLENRLRSRHPWADIVPVLADVCDGSEVRHLLERERPVRIFHAAAHKHVPMLEFNPIAAVRNNILGTWELAEAARAAECPVLVLISTDKAVSPRSVMGATKAYCERIVQSLQGGRTDFRTVRFGNVLGSNGSVLHTFASQIQKGGPVTVTDPYVARYLMSIAEASRLVLAVGALREAAGTYLLDMGAPVRILDLARRMLHESGMTEEEIPILFTGLRPGEKLREDLVGELEEQVPGPVEGVARMCGREASETRVRMEMNLFRLAVESGNPVKALEVLSACVSGYRPASEGAGRILCGRAPVSPRPFPSLFRQSEQVETCTTATI